MVIRDVCPRCKSPKYKKNGHIHNGKQNHHCHDCGRQFVQCCEHYLIAEDKRRLIERLLLERLSLRGICRAVGVTLKWLLGFLVQCFAALPDHLHVQPVSCQHDVLIQRLEVEADEMASFVQKKANKQWIWIAMDATTRQIIAFHVGDRSHTSAEQLWAKMPQAYRQHATFYTDQYVVYGRRFQLGEGWHSNENAVRFWHPQPRMPKETMSRCYAYATAYAMMIHPYNISCVRWKMPPPSPP